MSRSVRAPGTADSLGTTAGNPASAPRSRRAITNEIEIGARPEVVFDYMTDVRNEPQWNPQMSRVVKVTDGEVGRGTRFRVRFGRGVGETLIEHTRFDRPRSWASISRSRVLDVEAEGEVVEAPRGSRLRIRTDLHPNSVVRLALPLLRWWMHRTWDRDLRAAKTLLERPTARRADGVS